MSASFDQIVAEAKSWIGVKFKKGGRDRMGVDCIGLLVNVGRSCGIEINDTTEYSFDPEPAKFQQLVYGQTDPMPFQGLKPGSIILLRQSIFPMHTGILSRDAHGRLSVINANLHKRQVVEQPYTDWKDMVISLRSYKGVV
ncbi:cell wall-associated NlpC family hydrolase [Rhizobium rosettiformans]|uniref:NlpC/P60 family protein n=2 Tax=Rhizobium rosettiformans TaxID=1368430 RepID=A0A4S8PRU4_9HYPH|nr:NlpC/P60 family protein [Rhizobium rosettiformans]MBB5277790.1 cell wall-associated NlpC family hydrolase [Rhizobium rosettiformans]THV32951.1 NlpC/P60 family protein [Rhizobium rosettiformans W3]